jgi:hypothetical protein
MTRQRNPRDDLILALHAEIVRSTHESYELRDHMTCSTDTYDCHWEPSPLYAIAAPCEPSEDPQPMFMYPTLQLIRLEWCPRCKLLRVPE